MLPKSSSGFVAKYFQCFQEIFINSIILIYSTATTSRLLTTVQVCCIPDWTFTTIRNSSIIHTVASGKKIKSSPSKNYVYWFDHTPALLDSTMISCVFGLDDFNILDVGYPWNHRNWRFWMKSHIKFSFFIISLHPTNI